MKAIAVLTNRGLDRLLDEGGSKNWVLDPRRASRVPYVICVQNHTPDEWGEPDAPQGTAFLIGKVSGVSFTQVENDQKRYIIEFNEYAEINIPDFWQGWRNPVRYIDLEQYGIDPTKLSFKSRKRIENAQKVEHSEEPPDAAPSAVPVKDVQGLNMTKAKEALSIFYGVPVSAIEITIRG